MPRGDWRCALLPLCLWALAQSACVHNRPVVAPKLLPQVDQQIADELSNQIAEQYQAVFDFKAAVLMSATLGDPNHGKVKRYPPIRGYLLFRKPADLRIIGTPTFDLVSNGDRFYLSMPLRKRFVVGQDGVTTISANKLEKIRPAHLLEVLLPKPVDAATETMTLEQRADGSGGYTLRLMGTSPANHARPTRILWIDGATLHVAREIIFANAGKTLTDARYSEWQQDDSVIFPRRIEIDRPGEEYGLVIQIQKIEINHGLLNEMFVLEQPPGTELVKLRNPGVPPRHGIGPR